MQVHSTLLLPKGALNKIEFFSPVGVCFRKIEADGTKFAT
jgi:hypothetical protein